QSTAAAVDLANGDVFVDNEKSIAEFDSSGAPIQRFGSGNLEHGRGLAVDSATEQVYVADSAAQKVVVFGPEGAGKPEIDGESAENLTPTEERLNALIDPKGEETHYFFE